MNEKGSLPAFSSEADEAQWWFDNREARDGEFAKAISEGRAGRNTLPARAAASAATIQLDPDDIEVARSLADQRGLEYKDFLKQVVHEALQRELKRTA